MKFARLTAEKMIFLPANATPIEALIDWSEFIPPDAEIQIKKQHGLR
jgi:hypothetical protein